MAAATGVDSAGTVGRDRPGLGVSAGTLHPHPAQRQRGPASPGGLTPYYQDDWCTIYHGDCREILPQVEPVD